MAEAIFFDLYETLVTEFDPDFRPGPSLADRLGVEPDDFVREWNRLHASRIQGQIPGFVAVLEEICRRLAVESEPALLEQLLEERMATKRRPFQTVERPILAMVQELRTAPGLRLGLITNACEEEVAAWASCPLAPFFDAVVISCRVGAMKPETAIYHLACDRLGVTPEGSLFVGDGGSDELVGARDAGLTPLWATWFLERWPPWKMAPAARARSACFPRLRTPEELIRSIDDSWPQPPR